MITQRNQTLRSITRDERCRLLVNQNKQNIGYAVRLLRLYDKSNPGLNKTSYSTRGGLFLTLTFQPIKIKIAWKGGNIAVIKTF